MAAAVLGAVIKAKPSSVEIVQPFPTLITMCPTWLLSLPEHERAARWREVAGTDNAGGRGPGGLA
jgi:hypothetical protein